MALIERIMRLKDDGTNDPNRRSSDRLSVNTFFSAMQEVIHGRMTAAEFRTGNAIRMTVDASGRSDNQDLNDIVALLPASGTIGRANFAAAIHSIFLLAEARFPGYTTPAQIRAKVGI